MENAQKYRFSGNSWNSLSCRIWRNSKFFRSSGISGNCRISRKSGKSKNSGNSSMFGNSRNSRNPRNCKKTCFKFFPSRFSYFLYFYVSVFPVILIHSKFLGRNTPETQKIQKLQSKLLFSLFWISIQVNYQGA